MDKCFLGLDIGGTKCAVLLAKVDQGIHFLDKISFPTHAENGFDHTYGKLCEAMDEILRRNSMTTADITAVGVSCGGPLNSRQGMILCPPNLPGWVNIPLAKMLTEKFGVPAFILNDANACALVEWKLGAGRGATDMIFLTMGTGMGGGVIAEGKLLRGVTDMGGEIGHLRLAQEGPLGFGKEGSFEGFCSGGGIMRQAVDFSRELLAKGSVPAWIKDGYGENDLDARLMADYARKGDPHAIDFFNRIGKMLGRGLSLLVDAFNPARIVIGSIFVRCEALLRPAMEAELRREAIPFSLEGLTILPAETGERLGDLASIMVALHALGIDPMGEQTETDARVLHHYDRLMDRYPALQCCKAQIMEAYLLLRDCYAQNGKVLLMGNGGSCADGAHITGELMKGFLLKRPLAQEKKAAIFAATEALLPSAADMLQQGLPAIDLNSHTALITAVINDLHPSLTGAQQIVSLGQKGDVLIGISSSGNAQNVALAVATARALGIKTIGLTGMTGGQLKALCDCSIVAPADTTAQVQEYHLPVYHALCAMLEAKFFGE